jgi:hypothetical protein
MKDGVVGPERALEIHPTVDGGDSPPARVASLRSNRLDPKLLYVTPRQADLWRQVFLRHSPIHSNPEFARIYRDAFAQVAEQFPAGKIALVGLGCGTGWKELQLYSLLKRPGHEVAFSAVDVSRELVIESTQRLREAGAEEGGSLVCDLAETDFLAAWLERTTGRLPRLLTFFGLVPNLSPSLVTKLFRAVLRKNDTLLVSVHLAPVTDGRPLHEAMEIVLPQYDNAETRDWLAEALRQLGLSELLHPPEIGIGEVGGVPAFIGSAPWKVTAPLEFAGQRFSPSVEPFHLFHSLRYTPALFEELMRRHGFHYEQLAITACGEEAIWSIS